MSFHSFAPQTREGNGNDEKEEIRSSGVGEEELRRSVQSQAPRGTALGNRALPDGSNNIANKAEGTQLVSCVITRSQSEKTAMTSRSQRKLFKCQSELSEIPLKSGSKSCSK